MLIRVGTRGSILALTQTKIAINKIQQYFPDVQFEIVKIKTTGDRLYDANLALIGGKGLFLKEIEEQLIASNIDIAVHSMKDATVIESNELVIDCTLEREDVRDVFISDKYKDVLSMPVKSTIGSSSSRRKAILLNTRPDLNIIQFRGNVDTRINKMKAGLADATILAYAGLKRINMTHVIKYIFSVEEMLPAVAQGVIGIQRRINDTKMAKILSSINHNDTLLCITAERAFLYHMNADCTTAIAGYAYILHNKLNLTVQYIISSRVYKTKVSGLLDKPEELGLKAAEQIQRMLKK